MKENIKILDRIYLFRDEYLDLGSLESVGKKHNLSRERVRQILEKGVELGLFEKFWAKNWGKNVVEKKITQKKLPIFKLKNFYNFDNKTQNKLAVNKLIKNLTPSKYSSNFKNIYRCRETELSFIFKEKNYNKEQKSVSAGLL